MWSTIQTLENIVGNILLVFLNIDFDSFYVPNVVYKSSKFSDFYDTTDA